MGADAAQTSAKAEHVIGAIALLNVVYWQQVKMDFLPVFPSDAE